MGLKGLLSYSDLNTDVFSIYSILYDWKRDLFKLVENFLLHSASKPTLSFEGDPQMTSLQRGERGDDKNRDLG